MSSTIKEIPAENEERALVILNGLSNQYQMAAPNPDGLIAIFNEDYRAYYDPVEKIVKLETVHSNVTEEQIKEFLINFPPFF